MKNKKRYKRLAIVLACILIPLGTFGFGYFFNQYTGQKKVADTLTVKGGIGGTLADKEIDIAEIVPGDTINQSIQLNSTSTAPSLIRVKIEPKWSDGLSSNNIKLIYGDNIAVSNKIESGKTDYWYECSDGYLYYINSITEKDFDLIKGIQFTGGTDDEDANKYQGKSLNIKVTMDIIQSKYAPFKTRWGVKDKDLEEALISVCSEADTKVE